MDGVYRARPGVGGLCARSGWADVFDELREGRPPRKRCPSWRAERPVRAVAFEPRGDSPTAVMPRA